MVSSDTGDGENQNDEKMFELLALDSESQDLSTGTLPYSRLDSILSLVVSEYLRLTIVSFYQLTFVCDINTLLHIAGQEIELGSDFQGKVDTVRHLYLGEFSTTDGECLTHHGRDPKDTVSSNPS